MEWVWREYKNEGRENGESVKEKKNLQVGEKAGGAERSRLTCKTHFGITAAHCAKPGSLSLHAEGGEGAQMCSPLKFSDTDTEANILEVEDLWDESAPLLASYF